MITITTMVQLHLTKAINQMITEKLNDFYWTSITIIRGGVDSVVTGEYYGAIGKVMVIIFQKEHKWILKTLVHSTFQEVDTAKGYALLEQNETFTTGWKHDNTYVIIAYVNKIAVKDI